MSYTPVATVVTEPQDSQKASTAALEFRTLKLYLANVILPLIATKFGPSGGTVTGPIVSSNAAPLRTNNSAAALSFYATDATTLTGTLTFNAGGLILLAGGAGNVGGIQLSYIGHTLTFDGISLAPSASTDLGKTGSRWSTVYGAAGNFSGTVAAAAFTGDGSGLTGVPGATLTGGAITAALGYTPYNATNPSGYQTAAGTVANATNASNATTATKAAALAQFGTGNAMTFNWAAGALVQPVWVWGSNDGIQHNVWAPRNWTVAHADSADTATLASAAVTMSSPFSNGYGTRTISTSDPSGGADGDIWYKY